MPYNPSLAAAIAEHFDGTVYPSHIFPWEHRSRPDAVPIWLHERRVSSALPIPRHRAPRRHILLRHPCDRGR